MHLKKVCAVILMAWGMSSQAETCSSLKGNFGFSLEGQLVNGPPYAAVGLISIHRQSFRLELTESEGGVLLRKTVNGRVEMQDCGVTLTGSDQSLGFQLKGQIADKGKEIFLTEIRQVKPVVASGVMRPVSMRQCSNRSLKGRFNFISQGFEHASGAVGEWVPVGKIGKEDFDGKGCSVYEESIKQGASFSTASGRLDYQVAKNCTFELSEAGVPVFYGVMVDAGKILSYLKLTDAAARTGEYQRADGVTALKNCR